MMKKIRHALTDFLGGLNPRQLIRKWTRKMDRTLSKIHYENIAGRRGVKSPFVMVLATLASIVAVGIALGSFFSLILSLLTVYFIFTKLFGIHINLDDIVVV